LGNLSEFRTLPECEGDAARFQDFFCRLVAEVGPSLIRSSRALKQSAILRPANPWNWLLAVPVAFNVSGSGVFSQFDKGIGTALIQAMQDDQQLPAFQNAVIGELFYAHWHVEIGLTEIDYSTGSEARNRTISKSHCVRKRLTILCFRHSSFARSTTLVISSALNMRSTVASTNGTVMSPIILGLMNLLQNFATLG
jgi:hypothetical protein